MNRLMLLFGLALWAVGTIAVRLAGQFLLRPGSAPGTLVLYLASILAIALLTRRLCRAVGVARREWSAAAISLALPTLLLDPFSSAFFPAVFPNVTPSAAGLFGGWMLCCCAGALLGGTLGTRHSEATAR